MVSGIISRTRNAPRTWPEISSFRKRRTAKRRSPTTALSNRKLHRRKTDSSLGPFADRANVETLCRNHCVSCQCFPVCLPAETLLRNKIPRKRKCSPTNAKTFWYHSYVPICFLVSSHVFSMRIVALRIRHVMCKQYFKIRAGHVSQKYS